MEFDIKKEIKKRGLSVQEIAERMGISKIGLSQHINRNPTIDTLKRIADAIGCDVSDFFDKKNEDILKCPHCGKEINIKIE
ncbi:helix-turn-helix domain-containing protein [Bacteroidales bacterium OttesenSCG-928-I21]|nr:helix-turn-helix domain-containing protein [Bacteroidales bacterium OttesenSCG-928-I21]